MSSEIEDMVAPRASIQEHWKSTLLWLAAALTGVTLIHVETAARAVELWSSSSAYNYAFLIIPISVYLIWEDRSRVLQEETTPSLLGILVLTFFSVSWLIADAIGINEGRQLSLVGIYQGVLLTVLGVRVFRILLFPFTYLWLLVPTGEFLVPALQEITTAGSVWLLELSQIPTYFEGFLIQVPAGNFIVEPGCSGLNFILSSLALSLLYGKLTYRRWRTRLVCIFVAVIASILSNIVRVYLIIALTQITDRQLNIADDHLLYGWGFFAIIMLFMMWFGLKFEDQLKEPPAVSKTPSTHSKRFAPLPIATIAVFVLAAWPLGLRAAITSSHSVEPLALAVPGKIGQWKQSGISSDWKPIFVSGASTQFVNYTYNGMNVDVFIAYFPFQTDTFEPQAVGNAPADPSVWNAVSNDVWTLNAAGEEISARHTIYRSYSGLRHTVEIGVSGDCITNSKLVSRICGASGRYGIGRQDGAYLVLSVKGVDENDAYAAVSSLISNIKIGEFLRTMLPGGSSPEPVSD